MTGAGIGGEKFNDLEARTATVSPAEAAQRLGLQESTLANWRWCGKGPQHLKVGSRVRYRLCDLADWLDRQARMSTSDDGSHA